MKPNWTPIIWTQDKQGGLGQKVRKAAGNSPLYDKLKLDFRDLVPKLEQDEEIIEQNRFKEFVENTFLDGENIAWFRRSGNYKWDKYNLQPDILCRMSGW